MVRATALTRELASGVLGLLYPPHCYLCGVPLEESFVCPDCYRRLPRPQPPWCARCGAPVEEPEVDLCLECATRPWFFDRARSFGFYAGGLAELIRGLKYGGERALARELARYLFQAGDELLPPVEALTFVPMSRPKLRERGFNQAELLAQELGKLADLPPVSALVKVRQTEDQTGLGPGERFKNISGAFAPYGKTSLQRVVLVDDVYTTGATAEECARALLEGGFQEVYVLTVARSPWGAVQGG